MKKALAAILGVAALLIVAAVWLLTVRVPTDSVGIVESGRPGETPATMMPGFHIKPAGSTVFIYPTGPVNVAGDVMVTPAAGGEIPLSFTATCTFDPTRVASLHAAIAGKSPEEFHSRQVGLLLRQFASREHPADILTAAFRERASAAIVDSMKRGGLADATVTIKPPDDAAYLAVAQWLAQRGEAKRIKETLSAALSLTPGGPSWKLLTAMGLVNESEGLNDVAEKNYLDALALDPAALPPMTQLVGIYSVSEQWKKLARLLDSAITTNPKSLQHINWMAMALLKLGEFQAAEEILKKGLAIDPHSSTLLSNLGAMLMRLNRTDEAIQTLKTAVESTPENPQALFNLGSALASTDRFADALPYLQRAEAAGSKTNMLLRTLMVVHEKLGHTAEAAAYRDRIKQSAAGQEEPKKKSSLAAPSRRGDDPRAAL